MDSAPRSRPVRRLASFLLVLLLLLPLLIVLEVILGEHPLETGVELLLRFHQHIPQALQLREIAARGVVIARLHLVADGQPQRPRAVALRLRRHHERVVCLLVRRRFRSVELEARRGEPGFGRSLELAGGDDAAPLAGALGTRAFTTTRAAARISAGIA